MDIRKLYDVTMTDAETFAKQAKKGLAEALVDNYDFGPDSSKILENLAERILSTGFVYSVMYTYLSQFKDKDKIPPPGLLETLVSIIARPAADMFPGLEVSTLRTVRINDVENAMEELSGMGKDKLN